ncbi:type II toxin-antitoxin system RelE/ParE family toxin [Aurantimonas sp. VKM B-3413]|uniref:type II toxin-antitoxin system RelE family toxin n=1 Tax=Aurantimonas sp. VKM B-3413 TaxID=2779401 RepID=UPI001E606022|nr:type II toxin-antitoxin system RelE/ParE family toxin [Aurantimonas sp. VKM B-3413]MCB8837674.1 type II toxin-antitoxin system RelE/ParE family toxin [Aurantimonas sp. VKM B-3413]
MDVRFTKAARKGLKSMPAADQRAMVEKLVRYAETGLGDVIKLGQPGYRLRHGDWRAVFELVDGIYVIRIAHPRDVYR